jgi:hypothetical protein
MARLLCESNINFTDASWKVIHPTGYSMSEAASTPISVAVTASTTWTPGAGLVYEGVLLRVATRVVSPIGTLTVQLYNVSDAVVERSVTCNVSDISGGGTATPLQGNAYFKFSSTYTTVAAKVYSIRLLASVVNQITFFRTATASDWSRAMVTSTTAAPASTDELYVNGPITGAGAVTVVTCTMNNTASTNFAHMAVGENGRLVWGTTPGVNYLLNLTGITVTGTTANAGAYLTGNGYWEMGNSSTRMPATSTATLNLVSAGLGASGNSFIIRAYSTFLAYGQDVNRIAKAAANISASATSITTNVSTGWKNGDLIGIGATARSATPQFEQKALTADASGTTLSISAVTNAKDGVAPVQCDLINLTSNVIIKGTSQAQTCSINKATGTGTINFDNVSFQFIGSATASYRGIDLNGLSATSSDVINFRRCVFSSGGSSCIFINTAATIENITIDGCVFYGGNGLHIAIAAMSLAAGTCLVKDVVSIGASIASAISILDENVEVNNIIVNAATGAFACVITVARGLKPIDGIEVTCCSSSGLLVTLAETNISNLVLYRTNQYGLLISTTRDSIINNVTSFGNTIANIGLSANASFSNLYFNNVNCQAGVTNTSPIGLLTSNNYLWNVKFSNSSFGTVTTHSTSDVNISTGLAGGQIIFIDSTLASTTQVSNQANLGPKLQAISIQKSDGTSGVNRSYFRGGRLDSDSVIFDSSPRSARLTPISATNKLYVPAFKINVANGTGATVSIKVRKSNTGAGDSATYNDADDSVKLTLRSNAAAGSSYDSDIVAASSTAASNGAWETLSYTLPSNVTDDTALEFWIECVGTGGFVNFDTVTVS